MMKITNIDVLDCMGSIVGQHTKHYRSDFEIDRSIILEAAEKQEQPVFIWLCRTSGTWLLRERNVLLKRTGEHSTLDYYATQESNGVLLFLVEITGRNSNHVTGNIYHTGLREYHRHVLTTALIPETLVLYYEHGYRIKNAESSFSSYPDVEFGALQSYEYKPHSDDELSCLLRKERQLREQFRECDINSFMRNIARRSINERRVGTYEMV